MLEISALSVRRVLLPAVCVAFFSCMTVSAAIFYRGRPVDLKAAIISDLESPDDNPRGYGISSAGTAIAAILFAPAVIVFYKRLRSKRPKLAVAGVILFAIGLSAALAIGVLAPFTHGYTTLHIHLASAALIGICAGTLLHLIAARASWRLVAFQVFVMLLLIFLCYGRVEFDNNHLLTGLAFWEWVLCADCVVGLWVLAGAVAEVEPDGQS